LTSFVGRERDLVAVCSLLRVEARLVTLTGPGGVGKTRLAIEAATAVAAEFPDGVWFVPLVPLADPSLVAGAVAQTLGVREAPERPAAAALTAFLRDRRVLLVLDNFEHLLPAAPLVVRLLAACPAAKALVTSRALLRVSGERVYPVPPLSLCEESAMRGEKHEGSSPHTSLLTPHSEAVCLFVARARAAAPAFALTAANAADVAAICRRLDGLPLAIELAAARVKLLPPPALLARLRRRLPLLTRGARDLPARQRTLRDAIAWSHDLLTPDQQALFRRLAVFAGGFTLEAAEYVGGAGGEGAQDETSVTCALCAPSVLDGVTALGEASLLQAREQAGGEQRLEMLETVREYALERLAASGEQAAIQRRHLAWCLTLAEATDAELHGTAQGAWLRQLEGEYDNVRGALGWAADQGDVETGLRLAGALYWFWMIRHAGEGRAWLERFLAAGGTIAPAVRARALLVLAVLTWWFEGDETRAGSLLEEALALRRRLGDRQGTARALGHLAMTTVRRGDLERAATLAEEGLALARAVDDPVSTGGCLGALALVARGQGDTDRARELLDEAVASLRRSWFRWGIAWALGHLAELAREQGDLAEALGHYGESAVLYHDVGGTWDAARAIAAAGAVAIDAGQFVAATRLFGAAGAWREAIGAPPNPVDLPAYERATVAARAALGEAAFAAAWTAGRTLSVEQTVAEVAALAASLAPPPSLPGGLSSREAEVLRLVVTGLTSAQVAERLYLSPRTVQAHLRTVYRKLGVAGRAEATRAARELGLV
jgi:non-specific serine/threonine protein kinase